MLHITLNYRLLRRYLIYSQLLCRSCWALAQTYAPLSRDLFNAAFVSCWTELSPPLQQELINVLEQALMVPDLPEITQTILNLAEFMEHCEKVCMSGLDHFEFVYFY